VYYTLILMIDMRDFKLFMFLCVAVLAVFLAFSGMCYACLTFFHAVIDDSAILCALTAMAATYFSKLSIPFTSL
jgi:hypothetical protein